MNRMTKQTTATIIVFVLAGGTCAAQEEDVPDLINGTTDEPSAMSGGGYTLVGLCLPPGTTRLMTQDFSISGLLSPDGVPECYADCDRSTDAGVLDIFDFLCFQNSFVAGDPYACDCDISTSASVCDMFDFLCFQNKFVGGCP